MKRDKDTIVVEKNRKRAFWSLVIIAFMLPVSAWLLYTGLQPGKAFVAWALVALGLVGLAAFAVGAVAVVRTIRSPWHLSVDPSSLVLKTPTYDLDVPWESITGIVVDEVNRRPGCALVFDDPSAVSQRAQFHHLSGRANAVTDAAAMQRRMEENFKGLGFHLGIPGRILELGPEALAQLLADARMGTLWQEGETSL